jgi:hypothetical protein
MTDKPTEAQHEQFRHLLVLGSLFTPEERRFWLLELAFMNRMQARDALALLGKEYRQREAQRRAAPEQDAA